MKRAFLFGLGSFLILVVIAGIVEAFKGDVITGAIMIVVGSPLSVLVIRKANAAPPNKSRLHAIGGWLIGFFIIDAVMLAVALAFWVLGTVYRLVSYQHLSVTAPSRSLIAIVPLRAVAPDISADTRADRHSKPCCAGPT